MKQFVTLAISLLLFTGCSKDDASRPQENITTKVTVDYMGDPAVDGYGWVLRTPNSFEIPTNLPDEFKIDELNVDVVYTPSTRFFPCRCPNPKQMVNIVTISRSL